MTAIANNLTLFRLACMLVVCLVMPPVLCHYAGPVVGALGGAGAAALWYAQYRLPTWEKRSDAAFWFVNGGYGLIGITLLVCLGQLLG